MRRYVIGIILATWCVCCFTAATSAQTTRPAEPAADVRATVKVHMLATSGRQLSEKQVEQLETSLKENPGDLATRTKLLGYYTGRHYGSAETREIRAQHALWVIEHHPETYLGGQPYVSLDLILEPLAYQRGKDLWLNHVEQQAANAAILSNAANYFLLHDRDIAEKLLKKGEALEPNNPRWAERLGHLHSLSMSRFLGLADEESAEESLAAYERALALTTGPRRYGVLEDAARAALHAGNLKKAERYATELLDAATEAPPGMLWNFGNVVHHGNLVLGHVALRRGDIEKAEEHLIKAGKTPGSQQLNSFGPNMLLALELLKKDRRQAVIEYLKLCGKFWKRAKTDAWIKTIEDGGIPHFGANLLY